jgi:hypothetical protein
MKNECTDPLPALFQGCFESDVCGPGTLSEDDFPFLTSKDEDPPSFLQRLLITYEWTSPTWWIYQVAASTLITWLVVADPLDILPKPFDDTIPSYISNVAIGTFLFAAYGFFSSIATEQIAQFRNMGNAVTSFAGDLRGAFTPARARALLKTDIELTVYENCNSAPRTISIPGATSVCYLAMLLQSSVYGATRFLTDEGINIDLLPLKFATLYNEVKWNTSPRNKNQNSVMMRMALQIVQAWRDADIITPQAWAKSANNVGDYNSAIGALAIAKEVRPNQYSNAWLGYLILFTTPFIPLVTDFSDEIKILFGFIISFVLYRTLALRQAESRVTDLDNPLAGIRLKDEDDSISYAAVTEIAGILSMAGERASSSGVADMAIATATPVGQAFGRRGLVPVLNV